jgi:benzoate-CoA ligase family protein
MRDAYRRVLTQQYNAAEGLLDHNLDAGRSDKVAVIWEDTPYSYRQIYALSNRFGNALRKLGVATGDRVLFSGTDFLCSIVGYLGALKIGAVAVPVRRAQTENEYVHLLNDSRSVVAVISSDRYPILLASQNKLRYLSHMITTDATVEGCLSFSQIVEEESDHLDVACTHQDDPAFIFYSSGTTGLPKAVMHLHQTLGYACEPIFDMEASDIFYSLGNIAHAYGVYSALLLPFTVGGTSVANTAIVGASITDRVVLSNTSGVRRIFETIARYSPTVLFGVPRAFAGLLAVSLPEEHMRSVRLCFSASEPLPKKLWQDFKERFGIEILDSIGSTEAISFYISNRPGASRPGSSGQVMPNFQVSIVDETGNPVEKGQIGELWISGPGLFAYYWHNCELTRSTRQGEWFKTGDLYQVDSDGYYWYHGRTGDMIKAGGWVSPIELESLLLHHPAIQGVGVVGRVDGDGLTKPCAFVVLRSGCVPSVELAQEIVSFANTRLDEPFKHLRWVMFSNRLPYTPTGKLQRSKLRELTLEQNLWGHNQT